MYQVKVSGGTRPIVVDASGVPVADATVTRISFPEGSRDFNGKTTYYISGPGEAKIEVAGQVFSGVPLC
jgi:hypothetical protein